MTLFWDLGSGPGETQILRVFSTSSRYISPTHENSGSRKCAYLFWCAKTRRARNPRILTSQNLTRNLTTSGSYYIDCIKVLLDIMRVPGRPVLDKVLLEDMRFISIIGFIVWHRNSQLGILHLTCTPILDLVTNNRTWRNMNMYNTQYQRWPDRDIPETGFVTLARTAPGGAHQEVTRLCNSTMNVGLAGSWSHTFRVCTVQV